MDRLKAILLVVGSLIAIGAGIFGVAYEVTDVDEVLCGERAMKPGQRCADNSADAHFGAGRSYEAMRREQIANSGKFFDFLGVAGIVGGLIALGVGGYRLRQHPVAPANHHGSGAAPRPWSTPPTASHGPAGTPTTGTDARPGPRGQDALVRVEISLVECATGAIKPVTVDTAVACTDCQGNGFTVSGAACGRCGADGRVRVRRTIRARIPAGIGADQRLRLAEQGEKGPAGGAHGDLYLEIVVSPDPAFRREGADLHTGVRISSQHAYQGGPLTVATLIDGPVVVQIAPHTLAGAVYTMPGLGMPELGSPYRGALYVHVAVD